MIKLDPNYLDKLSYLKLTCIMADLQEARANLEKRLTIIDANMTLVNERIYRHLKEKNDEDIADA